MNDQALAAPGDDGIWTGSGNWAAICADPPWHFRTYSRKGRGRCADAHYDVMDLAAIKRLPVADLAAPDCALFLWAVDPMLPQALEVIAAWGFTFKTVAFNWAKLRPGRSAARMTEADFFTGLGYWTRANPELCLLATRGKPQRTRRDVPRLLVAARREHSRKPDEAYARIERLVPGPYLELFARSSRPGWQAIGLEAGLFDAGAVATRRWPSQRPGARGATSTMT